MRILPRNGQQHMVYEKTSETIWVEQRSVGLLPQRTDLIFPCELPAAFANSARASRCLRVWTRAVLPCQIPTQAIVPRVLTTSHTPSLDRHTSDLND